MVKQITHYIYTRRLKREEKFTPKEIKEWVNNQRESGKKRSFEGEPFQFDNLELIKQDYKKRRANGGRPCEEWMYSDKHLFARVMQPRNDPDEWSVPQDKFWNPFALIFPSMAHDCVSYSAANWGKLLPWHEVKACNGIVWKHDEAFLTENAEKCSYAGLVPFFGKDHDRKDITMSNYSIPTRGNCKECGANGPLGNLCINMCAFTKRENMVRDKEEDYPFLR